VTGDKRVEPLELFFDLVFVFALTQVTARLADDLSWAGLGRGMLVLALIWWAWAAYSWLTNEVDCSLQRVRLVIFASMICMLIASLAIPGAFEDDAMLFAVAYLGVRVLHVALFLTATDSADVRAAARALTPTAVLAPALLLVGCAFDADVQTAIWVVALLIDYVGGALRGIEGWRLSPGHFAERYGLIVIIALGESIVAIGVGAEDVSLDAAALLSAALGVVVSASLWWLYFDDSLAAVEHRLQEVTGAARNLLARDCFAFLHLPLVAGIVLLALGVKKTLGDVDEPLKAVSAVALCGGTALFLVAAVAFRARRGGPCEGTAADLPVNSQLHAQVLQGAAPKLLACPASSDPAPGAARCTSPAAGTPCARRCACSASRIRTSWARSRTTSARPARRGSSRRPVGRRPAVRRSHSSKTRRGRPA
jgi:low temperature requirement protein LtrA